MTKIFVLPIWLMLSVNFALGGVTPLKVQKFVNGSVYLINSGTVTLTGEEIKIENENGILFTEKISGIKKVVTSPSKNFFLIINYRLPLNKAEQTAEYLLFNTNARLIKSFEKKLPYDLPHPYIKINDQGLIASFDPLRFEVEIFSGNQVNKINPDKDIPFEMERISYLQITDENLFVLTSIKPISLNTAEENVVLYKIELKTFKSVSKKIDLSIPTAFYADNNFNIISGVKFGNPSHEFKTFSFSNELNLNASINESFEKIISLDDGKFLGKYKNNILMIDNSLNILNSLKLDEEQWIKDIARYKDKFAVLSVSKGQNQLFLFESNFRLDFKSSLSIFASNNYREIQSNANMLVVRSENNTIILN